tara:strand:+ start:400 stop:810 length:411 start_codon:yes stop_codon:yes gene_type:complete
MEPDILPTLRDIKIAIYWLIGIVSLGVIANWVRAIIGIRSTIKREKNEIFSEIASELFDEGKWDELIDYCDMKLDRKPNHSYALWYSAKAYYQKKELDKAKEQFRRLSLAEPSWDDNYIQPYMNRISKENDNSGVL